MQQRALCFVIATLVLITAGCKKKANHDYESTTEGVEASSIASYNVLEELEAEDSYLGSELTADDIKNEVRSRVAEILAHVDRNKDGKVDSSELPQLKAQIKDKMLEKFDVDSNGTFNQAELKAIQEKIRDRLEDFKKNHPEDFAEKKQFVCKVIMERAQSGTERLSERPLFQEILKRCQD